MAATKSLKKSELDAKWYLIDATGCTLGRLAAYTANILRGKHKPTWTPNMDCGDHVIIINCAQAILTGNKLQQKSRKWHTGWIGHLKEYKYSDMMAKEPERAMKYAVQGMLPKNTIGANSLTRLRAYKGSEHPHAAQKPEAIEIEL